MKQRTGHAIPSPGPTQPAPEPLRPDLTRGVRVEMADRLATATGDDQGAQRRSWRAGPLDRPSPLSHRDELHRGRIGAGRRERICSKCGRSIVSDRFEQAAVIVACCSCIAIALYLLWAVVTL